MGLSGKKCVPCEGGATPVKNSEIGKYLGQIEGWDLSGDKKSISRKYKFKNFAKALSFVNKIGKIAEEENHHPDIEFGWGYCKITLQTHAIGGLHENDFILAAKINEIED